MNHKNKGLKKKKAAKSPITNIKVEELQNKPLHQMSRAEQDALIDTFKSDNFGEDDQETGLGYVYKPVGRANQRQPVMANTRHI